MKRREIFDKVKAHLLEQNERSSRINDMDTCLYRGPNGLKCAVGVLIPDDLYHPDMEQVSAEALRRSWALPWREADDYFIQELQEIHDSVLPENWPQELDKVEKTLLNGVESL